MDPDPLASLIIWTKRTRFLRFCTQSKKISQKIYSKVSKFTLKYRQFSKIYKIEAWNAFVLLPNGEKIDEFFSICSSGKGPDPDPTMDSEPATEFLIFNFLGSKIVIQNYAYRKLILISFLQHKKTSM